LSLRAVVDAAVEVRSPLIVQTSKTVKSVGRDVLKAMFDATVAPAPVPVARHLDHCPDREVISSCRAAG
jgi:fructose-bisphosphate aldolase class II